MSSYIDASVTSGLVNSADLSGILELKSGGVTKATVDANGLTPVGDFKFNSGYGSAATAYGCRAWVNFNGTGTPAIRASGNVSSITDNGTGYYTANFTTAMPDANYAASGLCGELSYGGVIYVETSGSYSTSGFRFFTFPNSTPVSQADCTHISISIFR